MHLHALSFCINSLLPCLGHMVISDYKIFVFERYHIQMQVAVHTIQSEPWRIIFNLRKKKKIIHFFNARVYYLLKVIENR